MRQQVFHAYRYAVFTLAMPVFKLGQIRNIKKSEYERINMLNPLTIVDVSTYFKYKVKVARLQEYIANCRKDYLHKISIFLVKTPHPYWI